MTQPTQAINQFAASGSARTQKAPLLTFSIILFIAAEIKLNPSEWQFGSFKFHDLDNTKLLTLGHYILLYLLISYILRYTADYFVSHRRRLFYFLSMPSDVIIPSIFSLYVLYKVNYECDCVLNNYDTFYTDFSSFILWTGSFISTIWGIGVDIWNNWIFLPALNKLAKNFIAFHLMAWDFVLWWITDGVASFLPVIKPIYENAIQPAINAVSQLNLYLWQTYLEPWCREFFNIPLIRQIR